MDWWYRLNRFLSYHLTPAVKIIFMVNVGVFLFMLLARMTVPALADLVLALFAEIPRYTIFYLNLWRPVTYMFLHVGGLHILFNMVILWFFAPDLEGRWGWRRFWTFYLVTGAGAGLLHAILSVATGNGGVIMIGASGALYGVLLAYAAYYPNRMVLVWGILPVKIKWLVAFIIVMSILALQGGPRPGDNVSHVTHLAGLIVAYLYLIKYHHTIDIRRWKYMN